MDCPNSSEATTCFSGDRSLTQLLKGAEALRPALTALQLLRGAQLLLWWGQSSSQSQGKGQPGWCSPRSLPHLPALLKEALQTPTA